MNAVISGQAGVAVLVNGPDLASIHAGRGGEVVGRRPEEVRSLLGDARDLEFIEGIEVQEVSRRLEVATTRYDALHIALILLDESLSHETRREAAEELEELLEDPEVADFPERVLFSRPFPRGADPSGARLCCTVRTPKTRHLLDRLDSLQTHISEVYDAWERIPESLFATAGDRSLALATVVRQGLFRDLVRWAGGASLEAFSRNSLAIFDFQSLKNYRSILQEWLLALESSETIQKLLLDRLRHFRPSDARASAALNLLYLCHSVPYPPHRHDRIRTYHQIRILARRHRIHLLTLADGAVPDLTALQSLCEWVEVFPIRRSSAYLRSVLGVFSSRPLTLAFFDSAELRQRVRELARTKRFDAVVACSSSMAPYVEPFAGIPAVLDMVDLDSAKWEQCSRFVPLPLRPVYALEARRLRQYEASLARHFERIVLATSNEARLLKSFVPEARAVAVPNGVDLDYFHPLDLTKSKSPTLVFTGQMDYFANVDGVVFFAHEVFPRLKARFPDLVFVIVGRSPAPSVRALGELPDIYVTGAVGDTRPFLARAWVFVAPLRIAQGVQNKVLEAMAMNVPVVCTGKVLAGLAEGGFRHGRDLLAADAPKEMADYIAGLLEDTATRERLAGSARQKLEATYRWDFSIERFEELVLSVISGRVDSRCIDPVQSEGTAAEEARGA